TYGYNGGGGSSIFGAGALGMSAPGGGYGGGGSGGTSFSSINCGGSGGGGAHAVIAQEVAVTPGQNITVTIGSGGTAGVNPSPSTFPGGAGAPGFVLVEW
ncbi:MAG: hypothetical protein WAV98_04235, partial [Minisyncoccia bacterium]